MLIRQLPVESRTLRAVGDPSLAWSASEYLLAMAVDALNGGNWQRGGGKGRRPKPIPRPGATADEQNVETKHWGTVLSIDELRRRWHPDEFDDEVTVPAPAVPDPAEGGEP